MQQIQRFRVLGLVAFGLVLAGVTLASWATAASANAGPHPYNFTLKTSACGGCHRAHTAVGSNLLKAESVYSLCTSCHGGLVATDVIHGVLQGATNTDGVTPRKLNGGGFVQQNGANVTSRHKVAGVPINGTPFSGNVAAFGSQNGDGVPASDVGVGVSGVLECTSCHNPHGSTNYRILNDASATGRWIADDPDLLDFVNFQVLATRDDSPNYGFDTTNVNNCPAAVVTFPAGTPTPYGGGVGPGSRCIQRFTSGIAVSYANGVSGTATMTVPDVTKGMSAFCATCHKSYLTQSGSGGLQNSLNTPVATAGPGTPTLVPAYFYPGKQDAGDGAGNIARYRHVVEAVRDTSSYPKLPLRFAAIGIDRNPPFTIEYRAMGCLTCHYAHGSSAAATPAPGDSVPEGPAASSALLFLDNRGVCIACHQVTGSPPTPTPTP
jgi:predicted CXXCH cytochrome family protein